MYAIIARAASQKLATFKDTSKYARKEEQLLPAQMRRLKPHRRCMRELFTTRAKLSISNKLA